jgi:hypothetical protein
MTGAVPATVDPIVDLYGGAGNDTAHANPYPFPYNGYGFNQSMDMVPSNSTLILCAFTYGGSPIQGADVQFILTDPHRNTLINDTRISDQNGNANVTFAMPWPSDHPESVTGIWNAIALANVTGSIVNDTMSFIYDNMVDIWLVRTDKTCYNSSETVYVSEIFGTYSMQSFQVFLKTSLADASNATLGENNMTLSIGASVFGTAKNYTTFFGISIPSYAANGTGHVYMAVFDKDPSMGGSLLCPVYSPPPAIQIGSASHDVAVTSVTFSKSVVGQGYSMNITVAVADVGDSAETFNVTVFANATSVASQNVTLSNGDSPDVILGWNTTGFDEGNYTISAYAWPVSGETNTANNNFTDGVVCVSIPGDVNGDGIVDISDAIIVSSHFLETGSLNADINSDGIVDISDAIILSGNFLATIP